MQILIIATTHLVDPRGSYSGLKPKRFTHSSPPHRFAVGYLKGAASVCPDALRLHIYMGKMAAQAERSHAQGASTFPLHPAQFGLNKVSDFTATRLQTL